jgi:hypothetical protein
MNSFKQRPSQDACRFIESVFDLAFGATDGSEKLSPAEVTASLKASGIDPVAAWAGASKILEVAKKRQRLAHARAEREKYETPATSVSTNETRESLLAEILALFQSAGPAAQGMYARKHENAPIDDLRIYRDQLKSVLDRERRKNEQK